MKTKEIIVSFIKKYKVESVAVLIASILSAIVFDFEGKMANLWYEAFIMYTLIAVGSFLVDKIFAVYEDVIKQKIAERYSTNNASNTEKIFSILKTAAYVIVFVVQYLLYKLFLYVLIASETIKIKHTYSITETAPAMCFSMAVVELLVVMIIVYFVLKEKRINIKDFVLKLFMNYLFVFIIECVVLVGLLVLYLICEYLLGSIPYDVSRTITVFIVSIISAMGFFVSIENVEGEHSLFSKILVRYIMQMMVFVGFVIFYIYLIKIMIKQELPSNQVYVVCMVLFSIGLLTSLMSLAISEKTAYNQAIRYLPVAFIPVLILQMISIGLRINQHGLTTMRYFGIVFIIFEIVYLVHYVFDELLHSKKVKLEKVLLIASLLILISCFIPKINAYEFPEICNKTFNVKDNNVKENLE